MLGTIMAGLSKPLMGLIDDLFTSDEERQEAKLKLLQLEQDGKFKEMEIAMSAIIAEANSGDPWTSRARPSFLYVIYVMIIASIPMGILSAFYPEMAANIILGMGKWLEAIPDGLWALFGAGYLGYSGARSYDKGKGTSK